MIMYTDGVILIDRQAALAEIDATIAESIPIPEDVYINKGLMIAREIIEKLPTIRVDTERHGRWKCISEYEEFSEEMADYLCESCGYVISRLKNQKPKFCEGCGIRMDADEIAERRAAADDYAEY